jgi:hypothetical protein
VAAEWRCRECYGGPLFCRSCCKTSHSSHPFHRIQHWVGEFYQDSWLIETGLTLHFGHGGKPCPSCLQRGHSHNVADSSFGLPDLPPELNDPEDLDLDSIPEPYLDAEDEDIPGIDASEEVMFLDPHDQAQWKDDHQKYGNNVIVIVHSNGLHHLPVQWCRCPGYVPDDVQALDLQFFPASFKKVKTLFTFHGLDSFLAENQECKTSAWHYYQKLRRFTSGCFPQNVPVSSATHCQALDLYSTDAGSISGAVTMYPTVPESQTS